MVIDRARVLGSEPHTLTQFFWEKPPGYSCNKHLLNLWIYLQVFDYGPHKEIAVAAGIWSKGYFLTSPGNVCLQYNNYTFKIIQFLLQEYYFCHAALFSKTPVVFYMHDCHWWFIINSFLLFLRIEQHSRLLQPYQWTCILFFDYFNLQLGQWNLQHTPSICMGLLSTFCPFNCHSAEVSE